MKYKNSLSNCIAFLQDIASDNQDFIVLNEYKKTLENYEKTNNEFKLYRDLCSLRDQYHHILHAKYKNNMEYSEQFMGPIASLRISIMRSYS